MLQTETLISRDLHMKPGKMGGGPPEYVDGFSVGFVDMEREPPHGGEMHPDGDELLLVISGRVKVFFEREPDSPRELGAGDACIVPKGEWHKLKLVERSKIIYITPGPNSKHRPLA